MGCTASVAAKLGAKKEEPKKDEKKESKKEESKEVKKEGGTESNTTVKEVKKVEIITDEHGNKTEKITYEKVETKVESNVESSSPAAGTGAAGTGAVVGASAAGGDEEFISAADLANYKLELVGQGDAYSIAAKGTYTQDGTDVPMKLENLQFGDSGKIRVDGSDEIGKFEMRGRLSKDGKVFIRKQYIEKHMVIYNGQLEKGVIAGTYKLKEGGTGPFKIELTGLKWGDAGMSSLGINNEKTVGLLFDSNYSCWSVAKLEPKVDITVKVTLLLVDGTTRKATMEVLEGGMVSLMIDGVEEAMTFMNLD